MLYNIVLRDSDNQHIPYADLPPFAQRVPCKTVHANEPVSSEQGTVMGFQTSCLVYQSIIVLGWTEQKNRKDQEANTGLYTGCQDMVCGDGYILVQKYIPPTIYVLKI